MATAQRLDQQMTIEEFIDWMKTWQDGEKWELIDGVPFAMAGGTQAHETIAINITLALAPVRKRGCRIQRDILLRRPDSRRFGTFPDVYVRCGPQNDEQYWTDDPVAIFEVLSKSTMRRDRGAKQLEYFQFASLKHLVFVYQSEFRVELWSRGDDGEWIEETTILTSLGETLHLAAFDLDIAMAEIYADTELAAASA
jgi:Uma2 family endonuclease